MKIKNLKDQKFGLLTPLEQIGIKYRKATWKCKCDCGNLRVVISTSLTSGKITSCGYKCSLRRPLDKIFIENVEKKESCWVWKGNIAKSGYGRAIKNYKPILAHRLSWILHYGEIKEGLFVCHKCDNRACVNPDHLFLGTALDNSRDMVNKNRSRRDEKHPTTRLTKENVLNIRKDFLTMKPKEVSLKYNIAIRTVYSIANKERRSHI